MLQLPVGAVVDINNFQMGSKVVSLLIIDTDMKQDNMAKLDIYILGRSWVIHFVNTQFGAHRFCRKYSRLYP